MTVRDVDVRRAGVDHLPVPTKPSNRRVILQAEEWGCEIRPSHNHDWIVAVTPGGVPVDLRPAQCHTGTPASSVRKLAAGLGLSVSEFWSRPLTPAERPLDPPDGSILPAPSPRPPGEFVAAARLIVTLIDQACPPAALADAARAAREAGQGTLYQDFADEFDRFADALCADTADPDQLTERITTMLTALPDAAAAPPDPIDAADAAYRARVGDDEPVLPTARTHERGISTRVLTYLIEAGEPRTSDAIAAALGISRTQAGSAGSYLVKIHAADRIKSGVFVAVPRRAPDTTVGIDVNVAQSRQDVTPAPAERIASVTALVTPPTQVDDLDAGPSVDRTGSIDEEVEAVLDLLFPQGMTIRAHDLRRIIAWTEQTKALLREVRS